MELKIHVNLQVHFWLDTLHGDAEFTTKKKDFDKYEAYLSTKLLKSAHISPFFAPTTTFRQLGDWYWAHIPLFFTTSL